MALHQDSQKRRQCKLRDPDKGFFKVLLARSKAEDPLVLLLTPSAWTERTGEGEFRQPWTSRDLRESHSHLSSASIHPFPLWDYNQVVSFTLHRRKVYPPTKSVSKERYQMRKGEPCKFMVPFLCNTLCNVGNDWVHILKTPKTLGTNSSVLVLTSPSPGGMEWSFSPSVVMMKKKLES